MQQFSGPLPHPSLLKEYQEKVSLTESWTYKAPNTAYGTLGTEIYRAWKQLEKDDPKVYEKMEKEHAKLQKLYDKMYDSLYKIFN
jgi:hypothetical protein